MNQFLDGRVTLFGGDCRDVIRTLPDNSIDSCVSDPPYALVSISKRFGKDGAKAALSSSQRRFAKTGAAMSLGPDGQPTPDQYGRLSRGFMGKQWDNGEAAFADEFWAEVLRVLKPGGHVLAFGGTRTYHRLACAIEDAGFEIRDQIGWAYGSGFPKSHNAGNGWGTALKPAWEPIVMARKPLIGTVAQNVLVHGTGAINIDGCRIHADDAKGYAYTVQRTAPGATQNATVERKQVGVEYQGQTQDGRWPANIIHDGSDEVIAAFPEAPGQQRAVTGEERSHRTLNAYGDFGASRTGAEPRGDEGSAARFFYSSKADADDRIGSKHPTVKPVDLMQYLVRLVTPKGGVVLDPFAGTGTTGEAAFREGMRAILIEREPEYLADIERRMDLARSPAKRAAVAAGKGKLQGAEGTPLFDF
jgi:site-specific DNA-methyltransferase (adenine-specific)